VIHEIILNYEVVNLKNNEQVAVFCRNIKILRERNGLNKKEMSEIMGIGIKSLANIEKGILPPRTGVNAIVKLSQRFGIRPYELFRPL